ncbi:MAG: hypothetical protein KF912_14525 [Phycisphaeraceae bacterium]|nr:hypothetical protein [Phycisphaeraceae bacterium]MBX3368520.1 hypothetical protein [Phycisphaeraceae bacterium]
MNTEPAITQHWFERAEPVARRIFLQDETTRRQLVSDATLAAPRPSSLRLWLGILFLIPVPPIGIGLLISHILVSNAAKRRRAALLNPSSINAGRIRMSYPLMFNSLFMQGQIPEAPGLVLIIDDDGPEPDFDFMLDLVIRISVAAPKSKDPIDRAFAALMSDERYVPQRRRLIDPSVTGGRVIYAADLMANRADLVADLNTLPTIPCFIGRGPHAITRVVPARILAGAFGTKEQTARPVL